MLIGTVAVRARKIYKGLDSWEESNIGEEVRKRGGLQG